MFLTSWAARFLFSSGLWWWSPPLPCPLRRKLSFGSLVYHQFQRYMMKVVFG